MSRPDISVVVPAFNRPTGLARLLEALTAQRGVAIEAVIVDDGSPQPLAPVGASFANRLDLRILRQDNAGPASARNRGAAAARARYLAFTDDDCAPHADWAARLLKAVSAPGPVLAAGRTVNAISGNPYAMASQSIVDFLAIEAGPDGVMAPSNNIALPKAAFEAVGGFDTSYPLAAGEDRAFCRAWLKRGWPIAPVPEARLDHHHDLTLAGYWRQHSNYGRGAALFHATPDASRFDPLARLGFYRRLVLSPLRMGAGGVGQVGLVALAQLAVANGLIRQRLASRGRSRRSFGLGSSRVR